MVQESYVERYHDCPLEGCSVSSETHAEVWRVAFRLVRNVVPRKSHGSEGPDLSEVGDMTEVMMLGGAYDQLNMPSVMSFEEVCRRERRW